MEERGIMELFLALVEIRTMGIEWLRSTETMDLPSNSKGRDIKLVHVHTIWRKEE
jgi:hypothetical protein